MVRVIGLLFLLVIHVEAYENLALNKPAWQQNNWPDKPVAWGAAKAVDGLYSDRRAGGGQCTISGPSQRTAEWRVDLESVVSISHINIYYRTDGVPSPGAYYDRFAGFFVYISNITQREDGHVCFHELQQVNGTPTENQTISCPVHGRYVIYYNERRPDVTYPSYYSTYAYNEICELEAIGCPNASYHGENCDQLCPENCQEQRCNVTTGDCLGCIPGYQGPMCGQRCGSQKYGLECSFSCGNCSDGETCYHVNGTCLNGCNEGVEGDKCTNKCQQGHYGKDCRFTCSPNCLDVKQCNRFNGECYGGCKPGWKSPNCKKECNGRMYGDNCNESCGHCLNNQQCHHINGTCLNGCSPGYLGESCLDPCDDGRWGLNCLKNCSTNCVNETCQPETGACYKSKFLEQQEDGSSSALPVVAGILSALFIIIITVVILFVMRRFRVEKDREQGSVRKAVQRKMDSNFTPKSNSSDFSNIYANIETSTEQTSGNQQRRTVISSKSKRSKSDKNNDKNDDIDIDEKIHEENPYGDLYLNEELIPDIAIDSLDIVIKEKQRDENDGFKREYAALPYGERRSCTAGKLSENLAKNRFKTTFPYDHSRVELRNNQSDYINANFIHGIEMEKEYIASQGPKQNTLTDFWLMIWQEKVSQIVMLTNLKEGNKAKCVQYWPELNKVISIGEFSIDNNEEKIYAFYVIRRLRVARKNRKKTRIVTQYHYTAWPDHGIPEPLCLVVFHDHVTRNEQNHSPILVHCSAGIGRTGTYIALDALYKAGKKEKKINIAEYIKRMRENRMNMVQTYEQYITIFLALNHVFKACPSVLKKSEFIRKAELMTSDKPANQSELRREFQTLLKARPSYTEADYKLAIQSGHGQRSSILPLDRYSLFLSSNVRNRGGFINAVTLPSYVNNKAFIVTHYPPPEDAVDFLRLLTDHECDIVICMDPLPKIESSKKWMPIPDESKIVTPFTVHCQKKNSEDVKCSTIQIVQEQSDETYSVSILEPMFSLLSTDKGTSQLLKLVSFAMDNKPEGPITIVSSDGAALGGVFCAVYNVIQQLSMDGEVDIFSTVRQLQIRRPELCSTLEEYRLIHTAVLEYIREQQGQGEENIYSNE
ncbi:receptor-type tyrosine-protein phosphatase T-like [Saccostrea echinata]|uniref:receptor-type tyrosine-protein phosphatase T-like n=1 Tax=Saccostrea echinata TaxID=191078 RepID=UPI002A8021D0|nr:receptor-type tyrosine-protein phosphatase T-like [Saccostrea echinata]